VLAGLVLASQTVVPVAQTPDPVTTDAVTLTLRLAGERRQFRPGETIPIELIFDSRVPQRYVVDGATYDRSGRLTIDEFRLSPMSLVTDPMLDYFAVVGGYLGGGLRSTGTLGGKPSTVRLELNELFRFDTPGTFTLSVRTSRVTDETNRSPGSQPIVPVESNAITFDILPRDPRWEEAEFERARQILSAPRRMEWRTGCRILRFLGTNAAVDEMVRRYEDGECGFEFMAGLFGAPDRAHAVQQLEAGLRAPDQPVTRSYLRTLSALSVYLRQPEFRPPQRDEAKGRLNPGGELVRRPEILQGETDHYARLLEAALPLKTGTARAVSVAEHLEIVRTLPSTAATGAAAARKELLAAFSELPAARQEILLRFQWRSIGDPSLVPALRQLAGGSNQLADLALRRLYQFAPAEGRTRIIETIRRPRPGFTLQTLGALPDAMLPELDDVIARNIEADTNDFMLATINMAMLHRYASPAIAPRVIQHVVPAMMDMFACEPQAYALAYFLRVRPQDGADLLDRALTNRSRTGCYRRVLLDTAQRQMTPEVERRAIAALDDDDPRVVQSAIETLGKFGSAAAAPFLRAHFDAWHRLWQSRASELQFNRARGVDDPGVVNGAIESAYLRALAAPLGWLAGAGEIAAVREWCVTDSCRREADTLMGNATETETLNVSTFDGIDFEGRLAQYYINSMAALGRKLSQYPKGTIFTVRASGDAETVRGITAELSGWASKHGFTIRATR
jgi:hypothetical protein